MTTRSWRGRRVRGCGVLIAAIVVASIAGPGATGMGATAPTITGLTDQRTVVFSPVVGPVLFTVGDDVTPAADLIVTASSSNQALVPDSNLVLGGTGSTRSILALGLRDQIGATTITIAVSDGAETTTASFLMSVLATNTHVLAEGATGSFFHTDILLAAIGGGAGPAHGDIKFIKEDGTTVSLATDMVVNERTTIHVEDIPGLESAAFSTIVEVTAGAWAVERTMRWDDGLYGAHTEKASDGPARQWLFAEGSQGFFKTFFLLVNPQATANTAHVTYLREGMPPIVRDYPMLANSRRTIQAADDPDLVNTSFGARVVFDQPGMAERAMYFGDVPVFSGGTASAGVNDPSTHWFLAEGATGSFFATFVLLANPGDKPAQVTLTYLPASGAPVVKQVTVPAGQRITRNIATEDATLADAAAGVSVTSDQPILVERSQYWPNPAANWYEAHNSFGVTGAAPLWGLAEGAVGGPNNQQTYILLANPGTQPAEVVINFLPDFRITPSAQIVTRQFNVPATSRVNVAITGPGSDVPELSNVTFGARVTSTQPIVVERSYYYDVNGITWAAGTNATASRMSPEPRPAVAEDGPDQMSVPLGTTVTLTAFPPPPINLPGGAGPPYQWTFLSKPATSQATLANATTEHPSFVVDVAGDYLVQLVTGSGETASAPETVLVSTRRPPVDVSITATDANASEVGPDPGTFTITRTGGDLSQPLPVFLHYEASPFIIDFTDTARHLTLDVGGQFLSNGQVTIPANQTSVTVTLTPRPDSEPSEGPETFQLNITPHRNYFVVAGSAAITIADGPSVQP